MINTRHLGIIGLILLFTGFGVIIFEGRPSEILEREAESALSNAPIPSTTPTPSTTPSEQTNGTSYTIANVATHATKSDCWSAINGQVYDLTSFVSRHPGGAKRIENLCGIDGSDMFSRQHKNSKRVQSTLVLLKIGSLI